MGSGRLSKRPAEPAKPEPRVETSQGSRRVGVDSDSRPAPAWAGDVELGVRAWVGEAAGGQPPPPDPVADGPDADAESVARKILLDQLTGQARSRKELADKLAQRDVPEELATRLLDRFSEVGLIDDEAFAQAWVESRVRSRGLAPRALAQELRRKGIDAETAREALDSVTPEEQEDAARRLVRRKLGSMSRLDHATATRRLAGMLGRKGYGPGLAFRIVKEELGSTDDPDDPGDE